MTSDSAVITGALDLMDHGLILVRGDVPVFANLVADLDGRRPCVAWTPDEAVAAPERAVVLLFIQTAAATRLNGLRAFIAARSWRLIVVVPEGVWKDLLSQSIDFVDWASMILAPAQVEIAEASRLRDAAIDRGEVVAWSGPVPPRLPVASSVGPYNALREFVAAGPCAITDVDDSWAGDRLAWARAERTARHGVLVLGLVASRYATVTQLHLPLSQFRNLEELRAALTPQLRVHVAEQPGPDVTDTLRRGGPTAATIGTAIALSQRDVAAAWLGERGGMLDAEDLDALEIRFLLAVDLDKVRARLATSQYSGPKHRMLMATVALEDHRFADALSATDVFAQAEPTLRVSLLLHRARAQIGLGDRAAALATVRAAEIDAVGLSRASVREVLGGLTGGSPHYFREVAEQFRALGSRAAYATNLLKAVDIASIDSVTDSLGRLLEPTGHRAALAVVMEAKMRAAVVRGLGQHARELAATVSALFRAVGHRWNAAEVRLTYGQAAVLRGWPTDDDLHDVPAEHDPHRLHMLRSALAFREGHSDAARLLLAPVDPWALPEPLDQLYWTIWGNLETDESRVRVAVDEARYRAMDENRFILALFLHAVAYRLGPIEKRHRILEDIREVQRRAPALGSLVENVRAQLQAVPNG